MEIEMKCAADGKMVLRPRLGFLRAVINWFGDITCKIPMIISYCTR